ncbi:Nucleotidyltransferase substrate binding protein, HI0074 family [Candidatus Electronema halotolerans]|jgi:uncharacterized protein with HEPN domain
MMKTLTDEYRSHLAEMLAAVERCVYFLDGSCARISWPLTGDVLAGRKKEVELFMALSAVNERFAKLQDTLGAAMRHAALLAGESSDTFIRVLSHFEKVGVLSSIADWQEMRALRNSAAHEYGTDYNKTAEHFNTLHELSVRLYQVADLFAAYCRERLGVELGRTEFTEDVASIFKRNRLNQDVAMTTGS